MPTTEFRTVHGPAGLVAEQIGAWGKPREWRIKRGNEVLCRTDSEVDARTVMNILCRATGHDWVMAASAAIREMGKEIS